MAGALFTIGGSPSSNEDPLVATQDWELLSMSTMSASTLLAHGRFGLPPPSTPGLHTSRTEDDGASRRDGDSDAEKDFFFRSSFPLDVSQIAVIRTSSTPSVEPFTEGWKPQFRIAGAALQENYYAPDPFAPAASNTRSSLEPFLDMEQGVLKEPSIAANDEAFLDKKKGFHPPGNTGKFVEFLQQQEINEDHLISQEEILKVAASNDDHADENGVRTRKILTIEGKRMQQKRQGFFHRKSHVVWSVAVTTALLGVILVTYCSQTEPNELLTGDEVG